MTAIQTETELALLEPHPEPIHETFKRLNQSANRSARLANQLLSIARIDPSNLQNSTLQKMDLKIIGIWAANTWAHQAFISNADLGFELESAMISGNEYLLQELISNLIHNAFEHAGNSCEITVHTYVDGESSILEVEDNGPGIDPEEQVKVFQRFFRGRKAKGNGSGLGLSIVKEIATKHHAEIRIKNKLDNKGLIVTVSFPLFSVHEEQI